ncbi:MAG: hypothetical protein OES38_14460 [Gammaproteobacteria bacterium]|nr:hypothetical protein [Gammaproteobacteria bacterium]
MASQQPPRGTQRKRQRRNQERGKGTVHNRRLGAGKRNRLGRTILLGTVAVAFALFWLARELELDRDELLGYLATSVLFVAVLIACAVLGAGLLWLIKRLR